MRDKKITKLASRRIDLYPNIPVRESCKPGYMCEEITSWCSSQEPYAAEVYRQKTRHPQPLNAKQLNYKLPEHLDYIGSSMPWRKDG